MFNVEQKHRHMSSRSTAVPMDFEFTNRPSSNVKPAWATGDPPHTPKKRNHDEANAPPLPSLTKSTASEPFFIPTNEPHLFPIPGPHTSSLPHRQPPHPCVKNPDIVDVDMGEISPNILKIQQQPQEASPSKLEKDLKVVALDRTRSPFRSRRGKVPPGRYDLDVGGGSVNSEDEERSDREGQAMKRARPTTNHHYTLKLATDIPATNADLPYALSGYLRVFFSTSLSMVFLWLLLQFILTVQKDVQQRVLEHSMDVVQEIKVCSVLYKNNFCEGNVVPHMFQPCGEWETCMNRDPSKIGRARIGAQLLAEIVNAFVENISWKTFFFSVVSLAFFTLFINSLFAFCRSRHHRTPHPTPISTPQPQYVMRPSTPRRGKSSSEWEPGKDGDDLETPTKQRRMNDSTAPEIKKF